MKQGAAGTEDPKSGWNNSSSVWGNPQNKPSRGNSKHGDDTSRGQQTGQGNKSNGTPLSSGAWGQRAQEQKSGSQGASSSQTWGSVENNNPSTKSGSNRGRGGSNDNCSYSDQGSVGSTEVRDDDSRPVMSSPGRASYRGDSVASTLRLPRGASKAQLAANMSAATSQLDATSQSVKPPTTAQSQCNDEPPLPPQNTSGTFTRPTQSAKQQLANASTSNPNGAISITHIFTKATQKANPFTARTQVNGPSPQSITQSKNTGHSSSIVLGQGTAPAPNKSIIYGPPPRNSTPPTQNAKPSSSIQNNARKKAPKSHKPDYARYSCPGVRGQGDSGNNNDSGWNAKSRKQQQSSGAKFNRGGNGGGGSKVISPPVITNHVEEVESENWDEEIEDDPYRGL